MDDIRGNQKIPKIYKPYKTEFLDQVDFEIRTNWDELTSKNQSKQSVLILPVLNEFWQHHVNKLVKTSFSALKIQELKSSTLGIRIGIYARSSPDAADPTVMDNVKENDLPPRPRACRSRDQKCIKRYVPPALREQARQLSLESRNRGRSGWDHYWKKDAVTTALKDQPGSDEVWQQLSAEQIKELLDETGFPVMIIKPIWKEFKFDVEISIVREYFCHMMEAYDMDIPADTELKTYFRTIIGEHYFNVYPVDERHAIIVFSEITGPEIVHSMVLHNKKNFRPVVVASKKSKLKILQESLVAPIANGGNRPPTTAVVANRLITGSLGLRGRVTNTGEGVSVTG